MNTLTSFNELRRRDAKAKQAKIIYILTIPVMVILSALAITYLIMTNAELKICAISIIAAPIATTVVFLTTRNIYNAKLRAFEMSVLNTVGIDSWKFEFGEDVFVNVKSRQGTNIIPAKFFKADIKRLIDADTTMEQKREYKLALNRILQDEDYQELSMYKTLEKKIINKLRYTSSYYIVAHYSSPTGRVQVTNTTAVDAASIKAWSEDASLLKKDAKSSKTVKKVPDIPDLSKTYSVVGRIKAVTQPRGGYINPSDFQTIIKEDGKVLSETENIHASVIGMAVDYLTRFSMGTNVSDAFEISLLGAECAQQMGVAFATREAERYLNNIKGLDDNSIINACKLVTFDVWFRNTGEAFRAKRANSTEPDTATIENIRVMIERSISFFKEYGPITVDGFTFEPGGYTATVSAGDGDFLTNDTLWDFKVTKSKITSKHTLQLLMYWIMGQHSGKEEFKGITKLGVFNPRLNTVYLYDTSKLPADVIAEVERDVICY